MQVRPARRKDIPAIVELLVDDELGQSRERLGHEIADSYYDAFTKIDSDPNQELMVAENEDGIVAGTFQLSFIPSLTYQGGLRAQVEAIRIHRDLRGQGLGEQLIRWAINRASKKGAHLVQLTTDKKRPNAIRFYERLGFVASHEGMKLHF